MMPNAPIEPFPAPEIFADGVANIRIIQGVVRITLYSRRNGESQVVARLAVPVAEMPDVINALTEALA